LRQRLEAGGDIGSDCRGGFGRSGMRSARLLGGVERRAGGARARDAAARDRDAAASGTALFVATLNGPVRRGSNRRCFE
jgi:hypothetical protein